AVNSLSPGQIAVLENLRFHKGEEKNDPEFAKELAALGDLYVNDAFSSSHRAHASTEGVTHYLPSYAGPLMMEEIEALRSALERPDPPTAAIVGGAKISTKIPVLMNLIQKVDKLIIAGAMANTFYLAQGVEVGRSLAEPDHVDTAEEVMKAAKAWSCEVVLPSDAVVAHEFKVGVPPESVASFQAQQGSMIANVAPMNVEHPTVVLFRCLTLLGNAALGADESPSFGAGALALAREAARLTKDRKRMSIAG